jgi:hypothetical protein
MADARITFHELSFVPEGADVVVGRGDTGTYAVLPSDGAELLRRLIGGSTAAEAATWYERSFGETVDVDDFLQSMNDLGFIRAPGSPAAVSATAAPRFQWLGRALFSAPAWLVYGAIVAFALIELVRRPGLRPTSSHVYFTGSLVTVELVMLFGQIPRTFAPASANHRSAGPWAKPSAARLCPASADRCLPEAAGRYRTGVEERSQSQRISVGHAREAATIDHIRAGAQQAVDQRDHRVGGQGPDRQTDDPAAVPPGGQRFRCAPAARADSADQEHQTRGHQLREYSARRVVE